MPHTLAQKILQAHTDEEVREAGQIVNCHLSGVLANDITGPLAIKSFRAMGAAKVFDKDRVFLVMDHFTPQKDIDSANQVMVTRKFAQEMDVTHYYEGGDCGVEHALLPEQGLVKPGDLVIGADSHTCTYGGLGAFATGLGSTDVAAGMALGRLWFKVPPTIRVEFEGKMPKWLRGKDLILRLIGDIGVDGALYKALEFGGETLSELDVEARLCISNMAIEAGGKCGLFPSDEKTLAYCRDHNSPDAKLIAPDAGATYERIVRIDVSNMEPQVSCPHLPENTKPVSEVKDVTVKLQLQTENLTRNDLKTWRWAWQQAINVEQPRRTKLYNIYTDVDVDGHLTGCVEQRTGFVMNKGFKITDRNGNEMDNVKELFEAPWFKVWMRLSLESIYQGNSLIELGPVITVDDKPVFSHIKLVPRTHVIPEFGVIIRSENDTWQSGFDYRTGAVSWNVTEAGGTHDLGLYLKCALQTIPKKNMASFWDMFGEIFGIPLRIGTTTSRDPKEFDKLEKLLRNMGAASYGLFPEGTTIDIKESTRGDAYNVYDRRIERCNSELSKAILTQTMTVDNGASLSQSKVHENMLDNLINKDADMIRDLVNWQLIPRMIYHGFPVKGCRFEWDDSVTYTPEQQVAYERMVMEHFEVDPKYVIEKYQMPVKARKETTQQLVKPFFD